MQYAHILAEEYKVHHLSSVQLCLIAIGTFIGCTLLICLLIASTSICDGNSQQGQQSTTDKVVEKPKQVESNWTDEDIATYYRSLLINKMLLD